MGDLFRRPQTQWHYALPTRLRQQIINKPLRCKTFQLRRATTADWRDIGRVTIDMLPEDVLIDIFDDCVAYVGYSSKYEGWEVLVHVCQRWRYLVFRSPLRLNLRIRCTAKTPVREKLAIWPPLPMTISHSQYEPSAASTTNCGEDNIIAALGHNDRIWEIYLTTPRSLLESIFVAMQTTFAELKNLHLYALDDIAPVVPDSFLGGSAPQLRYLFSARIQFPFPVLRKLLLSAPNLVTLHLIGIPHSAYFSPEAMVTCLAALTRLKQLYIGFKSPQSRPSRGRRHPPPIRSVLPDLTKLTFTGVSEYLEDLVTGIDAPLLNQLSIRFFHQLIFNTPQLVQFIGHTLNDKEYNGALVFFSDSDLDVTITLRGRDNLLLQLKISCRQPDWQLSSLAQVCTSSFPRALIPMLENLYILKHIHPVHLSRPIWQDDLENNQWSELFHPFTAVKNLYLSLEFVPRIALALKELVGERITEVLPNLQNIFLEDHQVSGSVPEAMQHFIAVRQLSSRPIAISTWKRPVDTWAPHL